MHEEDRYERVYECEGDIGRNGLYACVGEGASARLTTYEHGIM